jgi:hypothetical protein
VKDTIFWFYQTFRFTGKTKRRWLPDYSGQLQAKTKPKCCCRNHQDYELPLNAFSFERCFWWNRTASGFQFLYSIRFVTNKISRGCNGDLLKSTIKKKTVKMLAYLISRNTLLTKKVPLCCDLGRHRRQVFDTHFTKSLNPFQGGGCYLHNGNCRGVVTTFLLLLFLKWQCVPPPSRYSNTSDRQYKCTNRFREESA